MKAMKSVVAGCLASGGQRVGQPYTKECPAVFAGTGSPYPADMGLDQLATDREPQTQPGDLLGRGVRRAPERLEDCVILTLRQADALVGHGGRHAAGI